jgi:ABC-type uncharacterized transport system substrate-binding protein
MSYGTNLSEIYRRAAIYVDKILRGAKPAALPVEQRAESHDPTVAPASRRSDHP